MANTQLITAARLREILNYDPLTGKFVWLRTGSNYTRYPRPGRTYKSISINRRRYSAAQLAWLFMTGEWPSHHISFINHNSFDIRWSNLRLKKHPTEPLSVKELRETLDYFPKTGKFKRKDPFFQDKKCGCFAKATGGPVIKISIHDKSYLGHVLAWAWMTGKWPTRDVDHKNRIGTDNRWRNLRLATDAQNRWNTSRKSNNTSGYPGVHWNKKTRRWMAFISIQFDKKEDAIKARRKLVRLMHGEFAAIL